MGRAGPGGGGGGGGYYYYVIVHYKLLYYKPVSLKLPLQKKIMMLNLFW